MNTRKGEAFRMLGETITEEYWINSKDVVFSQPKSTKGQDKRWKSAYIIGMGHISTVRFPIDTKLTPYGATRLVKRRAETP